MASQQILFAETIAAMKKAVKRKAYESDSDSEVARPGNRGQKLKKRARFIREGQLAPPSGPEAYREVIDHAGYQRAIISRNPPLVDDEGFGLDSDDDEERVQDVIASATEFDPYSRLRIESILAPLTTVTELPAHPTMSRAYKSKTLTELADQGLGLMHKENHALWKVKHLHTRLTGDHVWAPCDVMLGPQDVDMYKDDFVLKSSNSSKGSLKDDVAVISQTTNGERSKRVGLPSLNGDDSGQQSAGVTTNTEQGENNDVSMADADPLDPPPSKETKKPGTVQADDLSAAPNFDAEDIQNKSETKDQDTVLGEAAAKAKTNGANGNHAADDGASRRMSLTPEAEELLIHPLFLAPRSAQPDRDLGLPEQEAEDIRRLLQMYVQKQEEVCRGTKKLYEGLLKADRLRKTVFQWSKYEAHSGPNRDMSDGEDWYDKEEWDLEDDLKKGQDEEEEDTTQTAKKTRNRR